MNKKDFLSKFLVKSGLLSTARILLKPYSDKLIILAYHRIYDIGNEDLFPFDPELVSATPSDFKQQMLYIKKHYNPVSINDIIDHQQGNKKLPSSPVLITFDDGHKDNYTHAFPILKSLQMPATIFISTGYIGSNKIFWFDWVAHVIYKTKSSSLVLNNNQYPIKLEANIFDKRKTTKHVLKYLMTLKNKDRISCIEEIKQQLSVKISKDDMQKSSALSWEQISEMSKNRIEFGSHTVSHPILSKLDETELFYELEHSKSVIESHTGLPVKSIAYPVGGKAEFTKHVINTCQDLGYKIGFSYISGTEKKMIEQLFKIKRLHVERYTSFDRFKSMLTMPHIFD